MPPSKVVTSEAMHFPFFWPQAPPEGPESDVELAAGAGLGAGAGDDTTGGGATASTLGVTA